MADWTTVTELGRALPEVEVSTSYGTPALKLRNRLLARLREDPEILVVRVDPSERPALLGAEPDRFFVTPHYADHPWILVRLPAIDRQELRELLTDAWLLRAPQRLRSAHEETLVAALRRRR